MENNNINKYHKRISLIISLFTAILIIAFLYEFKVINFYDTGEQIKIEININYK